MSQINDFLEDREGYYKELEAQERQREKEKWDRVQKQNQILADLFDGRKSFYGDGPTEYELNRQAQQAFDNGYPQRPQEYEPPKDEKKKDTGGTMYPERTERQNKYRRPNVNNYRNYEANDYKPKRYAKEYDFSDFSVEDELKRMNMIGFKEVYDIDNPLFNKYHRYGRVDPNNTFTAGKEFVFFTKPNLNIIDKNNPEKLVPELEDSTFFRNLAYNYPQVIQMLQYDHPGIINPIPFNYLLSNNLMSELDVPGVNAEYESTPKNLFGTSYEYRKTSESSDDNFDFSLSFRDDKYLTMYMFFKAYDEYFRIADRGALYPDTKVHVDKSLNSTFGIYKFITDADHNRIIYFAKFTGVSIKNLNRDVFSTSNFDKGIIYDVQFKAPFVTDMDFNILHDFNMLSFQIDDSTRDIAYDIRDVDQTTTNFAKLGYITSGQIDGKLEYYLEWRA